jgi:hypothetical protein
MGFLNFLAIGIFLVFFIPKIFAVCTLVLGGLLGPLGIILGIIVAFWLIYKCAGG